LEEVYESVTKLNSRAVSPLIKESSETKEMPLFMVRNVSDERKPFITDPPKSITLSKNPIMLG
jgi:hypothetical protein